jgi:hypothetical protein
MLQHVIDAERIFSYRALRFARKDPTPLPGFDENLFAENAKADKRNWMIFWKNLKLCGGQRNGYTVPLTKSNWMRAALLTIVQFMFLPLVTYLLGMLFII